VVFTTIYTVKQLTASTTLGLTAAVPDMNNEPYRVSHYRQSEGICLYRVAQKSLDIITVGKISTLNWLLHHPVYNYLCLLVALSYGRLFYLT
jgi:hypothetical protein